MASLRAVATAPPAWTPLPREARELQALVRRLDALVGMQTDERNRAQAGELTPAVQQSIEAVLAHLEAQIRQVRAQIRDHIDRHPHLRSRARPADQHSRHRREYRRGAAR